jgi:cupin 2 domain-containing protein
MDSLLRHLPAPGAEEHVEVLARAPGVRIERIVSHGHRSADDFWYEQDEDEWVFLVAGAAEIAFDDGARLAMAPGDWLALPAHRRHRVAWTDPAADTIWLCVYRTSAAT